MNIIFVTLSVNVSMKVNHIYADLMRKFRNEGNNVYIVAPVQRRTKKKTEVIVEDGVTYLNVWTLNIQKTNVIEKGLERS